MDDLQNKKSEIDDEFVQLKNLSYSISNEKNVNEKRKKKQELSKMILKTKRNVNNFKYEIDKKIENPIQKQTYLKYYRNYNGQILELNKIVSQKEVPPKEQDKVIQDKPLHLDTAQDVMKEANRVQDETNKSLQYAINMANTIEDTGNSIITELGKQTDKMYQINKEVDVLDTHLKRSKKEVQYFFRRLATDKLCILLVIIILLGVCGIIFWQIWSKRVNKSTPEIPKNTTTIITTITPPPPPFTLLTTLPVVIIDG